MSASPGATEAGTQNDPMSLETAIDSAGPGDTVMLAAGTYRAAAGAGWTFDCAGTKHCPVTFNPQSGRVTLRPAVGETPPFIVRVSGDHVVLRDIEVSEPDASPNATGNVAVIVYGDHCKLLYCTIHDNPSRTGLTLGADCDDFDAYGTLIYRNGEIDPWSNNIHGAYPQSVTAGAKRFRECLVFDNTATGFHAYTTAGTHVLRRYELHGVASWGNGAVVGGAPQPNFLIGTNSAHVEDLVMTECYAHHDVDDPKQAYAVRFGYSDDQQNARGLVEDCVFVGGLYAAQLTRWNSMTFRRNRAVGMRMSSAQNLYACLSVEDPDVALVIDNNEYWRRNNWTIFSRLVAGTRTPYDTVADWLAATGQDANSVAHEGKPVENWVYVRRHAAPGDVSKAHVIAYNWEGGAVTISAQDFTSMMSIGSAYTIASAYDRWTPQVSGEWDGDDIVLAHDPLSPYDDFAVWILEVA